MNYCENCGTKLRKGICSTCHEESYIETFQSDYIEKPFSKKWQNKVRDQEKEIKENLKKEKIK